MAARMEEGQYVQLGKKIKEFMKTLVETFEERCESNLYTVNYRLLDHSRKEV